MKKIYIPLLIVVVLILAFLIIRKSRAMNVVLPKSLRADVEQPDFLNETLSKFKTRRAVTDKRTSEDLIINYGPLSPVEKAEINLTTNPIQNTV